MFRVRYKTNAKLLMTSSIVQQAVSIESATLQLCYNDFPLLASEDSILTLFERVLDIVLFPLEE